jgi:signal transduction histidine kinase
LHLYERDYDFADIVRRALTETTARFKQAGIELVSEDVPVELPARGDPDKLRRAMVHILDNAMKFSPRGATVAVGVRTVSDTDAAGTRYQLVIADGGVGISAEAREQILEPFFQVDGSRTRLHGGVGLGLAYARHVAEALGGGIKVQSPPEGLVAGRTLPGTAILLTVKPFPPPRESTP